MRKKHKGKRNRNVERFYKSSVQPCRKIIDISELKDFAERNLPPGNPLREVIICDKSTLSALEFLAKLPIWLKLCNLYSKD